MAEELHDPQNLATEQNGETECAVQSFAGGDGCPQKSGITDDIGNVCGLTAEPDSPRQPDSGHEGTFAGGGPEFLELYGFRVPNLHAAQHTRLPVDAP